MNRTKLLLGLLLWYGLLWLVLAIAPRDRQDWLLENFLALAAVVTLVATYHRFQFSTVSYLLITAFLSLHAVGAHYTYAEVPFGFWLQNAFGLSRNPFDRLVHLDLHERTRVRLWLCPPVLSECGDGHQETTLFGLAWATLVGWPVIALPRVTACLIR